MSKIYNKIYHFSFIVTRLVWYSERKSSCLEEEEESELFIEVDCFNVESVLSPAPEGLSQQQVKGCSSSSCERRVHAHSHSDPSFVSRVVSRFLLPQLVRRCILGSILESEKNYLDSLKRILEVNSRHSVHLKGSWGFFL